MPLLLSPITGAMTASNSPELATSPPAASSSGARGTGVLLLLLAATLWSISGVAVKWADTDPITFATLRSLGAAICMGPLIAVGARLTGRAWPRAKLMGITALVHTAMVASLIAAMTFASAAEGILLQYSAPAWAAMMGFVLFGRRVDRPTLLALVIALAGVAVMLAGARLGSDVPGGWIGPLCGVIAGIGYGGVIIGLDTIDTDARQRTGGPANVFAVVFLNNLASGLILLPWAIFRGALDLSPGVALFILAVGVVQMAIPYAVFQLGLRRVGPVAAGLISLVEPVLNPLWAWLGAGERPPAAAFAGGALILAAVAVTAVAGRRRGVRTRQAEASDLAMPAQ